MGNVKIKDKTTETMWCNDSKCWAPCNFEVLSLSIQSSSQSSCWLRAFTLYTVIFMFVAQQWKASYGVHLKVFLPSIFFKTWRKVSSMRSTGTDQHILKWERGTKMSTRMWALREFWGIACSPRKFIKLEISYFVFLAVWAQFWLFCKVK